MPLPYFDDMRMWLYVIGFAAMLAIIDVIEQVMSNAAIQNRSVATQMQYQ